MGKVETAHPRFDRTPPEFVGELQCGLSGAGDVIAQSLCVVVRQFLVLIVHVRNPPYLRTSTRASSVPFPKSAQILKGTVDALVLVLKYGGLRRQFLSQNPRRFCPPFSEGA